MLFLLLCAAVWTAELFNAKRMKCVFKSSVRQVFIITKLVTVYVVSFLKRRKSVNRLKTEGCFNISKMYKVAKKPVRVKQHHCFVILLEKLVQRLRFKCSPLAFFFIAKRKITGNTVCLSFWFSFKSSLLGLQECSNSSTYHNIFTFHIKGVDILLIHLFLPANNK